MQRLAPPSNEVTAQSTRQEMRWLVRARRGKPSPGEQSVQLLGPVFAPSNAKSTSKSDATPPAEIDAKQHHTTNDGDTAQSTSQEMRWPVRVHTGKPSPGEQSVQSLGPVSVPSDAKSTANSDATPLAGIGAKQQHTYYSGDNAQSTRRTDGNLLLSAFSLTTTCCCQRVFRDEFCVISVVWRLPLGWLTATCCCQRYAINEVF